MECDNENLHSVISSLNSQITSLEHELDSREYKIDDLRTEIDDLRTEIDCLKTEINELKDKIYDLDCEKYDLNSYIESLEDKSTDLLNEIKDKSKLSFDSGYEEGKEDGKNECYNDLLIKQENLESFFSELIDNKNYQYFLYLIADAISISEVYFENTLLSTQELESNIDDLFNFFSNEKNQTDLSKRLINVIMSNLNSITAEDFLYNNLYHEAKTICNTIANLPDSYLKHILKNIDIDLLFDEIKNRQIRIIFPELD
jgi:chromosome segregation ATPase